MPYIAENVECLNLAQQMTKLEKEKSDMVAEMLKIKGENQNLHFEMLTQNREIEKLRYGFETKIECLNKSLIEWKDKYAYEETKQIENEKNIARLSAENKMLSAKVKQLQRYSTGQQQRESIIGEEFEVEQILKHTTVKGHRKFFISWKNYSSSHNSWVWEENLHCPNVLTDYLKSKHLL